MTDDLGGAFAILAMASLMAGKRRREASTYTESPEAIARREAKAEEIERERIRVQQELCDEENRAPRAFYRRQQKAKS